jgi:uncharacterized membrane protein
MSDELPEVQPGGSSTGLDTKLASLLCYLLGFVSGLAFLLLEKEDQDVRFHAYQSTVTFLGLFVVSAAAQVVPILGPIIAFFLPLVSLVLWILLIVGDWAEEQVGP